MADDVEMQEPPSRPPIAIHHHHHHHHRPPGAASPPADSVSTGASRHSSLAALMNPEPERVVDVSDHDDSQHEESEVEAETAPPPEEYDEEEAEEEDEGSEDDEEEDDEDSEVEGEEGDDSTKESILIAETHGPSAGVAGVPVDTARATSATESSSAASRSISIPVLIHPSPGVATTTAVTAGPSTTNTTTGADLTGLLPSASAPPGPIAGSKPASSTAKPRSKKPRSPSPSPPPPLQVPPLTTIRLEIRLGGPENYEVDVSKIAKDTGQRPPTPPPRITVTTKHPVSESEQEPETDGGKKKKRRKNPTSDYYDVNDPFIDDSELALDERTYFAQTKQQGFYVSSGEVALLKDKTPKKPKSKKMISLATAINASTIKPENANEAAATGVGAGGEENGTTTKQEEDGDERVGQKRKRYVTIVDNGKKRKVVDQTSFHPELQVGIEKLKDAIKAENWAQKGKFPPGLKPQLSALALQAIKLDEYDEHFFSLMPALFPYNKFTMTKLIKRTVFPDHTKLLMDRQEELLKELKTLTEEGMSKAEEEWEKAVVAWDRRKEKAKPDLQPGDSAAPTRHPTEEMDVDGQPPISTALADAEGKESGGDGKKDEKGAQPPQKRYRLTEQMKNIVWQLVLLSNECCRLENEKNSLEGSVIQVSEQGSRKNLYQRIVAQFPDGWMNSGQISREVSVMKKKYEKEAMEGEE
ncbi:hypothetical protein D9756_009930 [Leucocoprinus leucothites]|uniref:Ubinuclein middle domain-containing protein n=1 Tax=Leucocoprinus leucothites TaxID=201217 RepID=A0A8H5CSP0_9AGAR|nr:hypothetical protein D9756_009930 [Leucoagaricus leucothites]